MVILGIETSCDETAAAVLTKSQKGIQILSNVVASSAKLQAKYGGIIPEQAAREQIKSIIPVIETALLEAFEMRSEKWELEVRNFDILKSRNQNIKTSRSKISHLPHLISNIDAIAVTYGPGLIGSLLVGVETAKVLSLTWKKPLIPVNHLLGHFYANWIETSPPTFPCLGLLVSGGHTDLVLFTNHGKYKYLGGTRDDAAGECFDKCARLLGLPYPGGPEISKLASQGQALRFKLPVPMKGSKDLDFSYSGLKTAVARIFDSGQVTGNSKANLAAAIEETIVTSLVDKVMLALKKYPVKDIMIAGGVAANKKLASELKFKITHPSFGGENLKLKINLHIPSANLCTDNAAMIASAAFFTKPISSPLKLQADPNLSLI